MSIFVMSWVYAHSEVTGSDRLVLLAIADEADDEGANAYPSQDRIAHKARISRATVQRCIANLEAGGALKVIRPKHQGRGMFNRYVVIMPPVDNAAAEGPHERASSDAERASSDAERAQKGLTHEARPLDPKYIYEKEPQIEALLAGETGDNGPEPVSPERFAELMADARSAVTRGDGLRRSHSNGGQQ